MRGCKEEEEGKIISFSKAEQKRDSDTVATNPTWVMFHELKSRLRRSLSELFHALSPVRKMLPSSIHTVRNLHFLSKNSALISRENCRFFGWKNRENVVSLDFSAVCNFNLTRIIAKKKFGEKLVKMLEFCRNWIFGLKFDFSDSVYAWQMTYYSTFDDMIDDIYD